MTDPQAIADGLNKAQRIVICRGTAPFGAGRWRVITPLLSKGLATYYPFQLTPLGLSVRAILAKEEK